MDIAEVVFGHLPLGWISIKQANCFAYPFDHYNRLDILKNAKEYIW